MDVIGWAWWSQGSRVWRACWRGPVRGEREREASWAPWWAARPAHRGKGAAAGGTGLRRQESTEAGCHLGGVGLYLFSTCSLV